MKRFLILLITITFPVVGMKSSSSDNSLTREQAVQQFTQAFKALENNEIEQLSPLLQSLNGHPILNENGCHDYINDYTLLSFAVRCRNSNAVKALVNTKGVDVNRPNNRGFTPLCFALMDNMIDHRSDEIANILMDDARVIFNFPLTRGTVDCGESALSISMLARSLAVFRRILHDKRFNRLELRSQHCSLLHSAIDYDRDDLLAELLDQSEINVHAMYSGRAPLQYAKDIYGNVMACKPNPLIAKRQRIINLLEAKEAELKAKK